MPTTREFSAQEIARYREAAERRRRDNPSLTKRQHQAWEAAEQVAQLLREQFQVSRVVVFGSLARRVGFTRWSDVDIAAWGIAPGDTLRAIGVVQDLDIGIPVNLVDVSTARPSLLQAIEREGVPL